MFPHGPESRAQSEIYGPKRHNRGVVQGMQGLVFRVIVGLGGRPGVGLATVARMSGTKTSELRLTVSKEEAIKAILDALPKDAVVRGEDDGVGRFAGERTLVVVGRGETRLMLFQGTWGSMKARLDKPQLDVVFEGDTVVRLTREPEKKPSMASHLWELLSQMVTVAAVVVAYHFVRSIPVDVPRTVIIAVIGGLAWSAIGLFLPKKEDRGLDTLVRSALAPIVETGSSPEETE